jgi:DNA helicase II / ATP-dependent DNA helicase PcrA
MELLAHLNPSQKEATVHTSGPLLIIAGAGSGKTRVITSRIAYLLSNNSVPASQIIALTFTNKAALEMKERIAKLVGTEQTLPFVGTFHAYCVRLLKQYAALRNTPFGGILDTDDQHKLIKAILTKHGLHKQLNINSVIHTISHLKNRSTEPERFLEEHTNKLFAEIYHAYEQEKKLSHCLDFDDLLIETVKLFDNTLFTQQFHARVRHILIDEYQDTNIVQHLLLKKMCLSDNTLCVDSLCAVGDEDQSIYSWRGATVTNMRNFLHDFSGTHVIKIEQNYRSAQQILDIANTVIINNTERTPKKLWSEKKGNNRAYMLTFASEYQEADTLAQLGLLLTEHKKIQECAFLYRTHAQSRALEEALVKHGIPYRIIGGVQFYERMEIKDLLAYLKLLANPFDRISCARALNTPARGLGTKAEELLFETWNIHHDKPFTDIVAMLIASNTGIRAQAFTQFAQVFEGLNPLAITPSQALTNIIQKTGYLSYLKNSYEKEEAAERCANVDELLNAAVHAESLEMHTIQAFLESVTLMQDQLNKPKTEEHNCILLMTLHAAKGLEFDTVVLAGLEEGVLPTSRATHDPESLEEERRLLYVGITRTRERILFTRTRTRHTYGKLTDQIASRFTKELPEHLVPCQDASLWRTQMVRTFLAQWLGFTTIHTTHYTQPVLEKPKPENKIPIKPQKITSNTTSIPTHNDTQITSKYAWRLYQPVKHASFGIGIIKLIEQKGTQTVITAQFRTGTKKIVSDFLKPL